MPFLINRLNVNTAHKIFRNCPLEQLLLEDWKEISEADMNIGNIKFLPSGE